MIFRIKVEAWSPLAEMVHADAEKGSSMLVQGRLVVDSWTDRTGTKRTVTKVMF